MPKLAEWDKLAADPAHPEKRALCGLWPSSEPAIYAAKKRLGGKLRLTENRHGLVIHAGQHVGVIQLGPLRVTVHPKLEISELWPILIYALELPRVLDDAPVAITAEAGLADLLALLLTAEANRLRRIGLRRRYRQDSEWLSVPRGKLDVAVLSLRGPALRSSLPCTYHELSADVLANQLVRSGLRLAARLAVSSHARTAAARAEAEWAEFCAAPPLSRELLDRADQTRDRLLAAYRPTHRLVRLIFMGLGTHHLPPEGQELVHGYLWDMSLVFERFVRRFLVEHLTDIEVVPQRALRKLYRFTEPQKRKPPQPRPDLLLKSGREVLAIADTKYKDLTDGRLPHDILYQLSVYAASMASHQPPPALILYPQPIDKAPAKDVTLLLRLGSTGHGRITMRAVDWCHAVKLLHEGSAEQRSTLAKRWVE